ncbi:hypothetical protein DFQ26_000630 [Actinomortierella ambigua]|nr:hypothetical protein DFQ26_000630 [Actinomortierella ambigua]
MATARHQSLAQFKRILTEIHLQYSHPKHLRIGQGLRGIDVHANREWTDALKDNYREHTNESDPVRLLKLQKDAEDLEVYLRSQRMHRELLERYNPAYWGDNDLQVEKTAKAVGFEMPEAFDETKRDEPLTPMPRITKVAPVEPTPAPTDKYVAPEPPAQPAKRTYKIPKAFGFADEASTDVGRAGDRKIE